MFTQSFTPMRFGIIALLVSYMVSLIACQQEFEVKNEYDICKPDTHFTNPSRVFLRGPSDSDKFGQSTTVYVNWTWPRQTPEQNFGCLMMFKTDHRSQIRVDAVGRDFSYPSCGSQKAFLSGQDEIDSCIPGCVYIKLVDSDYKENTRRLVTTTTSLQTYPAYTSQSSKLHLVACDKGLEEVEGPVNMKLRLSTVLKHRQIQGYVGVTTLSSQTLTSPYFPERYVQNSEIYTYSFSGISGSGATVIAVTFDDWDLSQFSKIVFKVKGTETFLSGLDSRPYFIANSSTMQMMFDTGQPLVAGGYSQFHGFKAVAKFYRNADDVPKYLTDCDRIIDDNSGGVIVQNSFRDRRARDCIWIIKPSKEFSSVYLKVVSFTQGWGTWSSGRHENSLEVREGVTSDAPQSMLLRPSSNMPPPDYGEQTSSKGFYVRFKGIYADGQSVIISYSQFRTECNPRYEYDIFFKCRNGRCIDKALRCDSYDHCGDNTDEEYCNRDSVNEVDQHEGGRNYSYSISVGVIIPMVVVVFLIIVICLLVIFFKRFRRLRQSNSNSSAGSGILGGSGGRDHRDGGRDGDRGQRRGRDRRRRHRGNRPSHPGYFYPDYPPSYDEALVSTPVDMLNMAFPWSQSNLLLGQPPSYEDAMLETSESFPNGHLAPPYDDSNTGLNNNNNNNSHNMNNSNNSRGQSRSCSVPSISTTTASGVYPGHHVSRLMPGNNVQVDGQSRQRQGTSAPSNLNSDVILDPCLAPGAYVSSSSSSEASETEMQLDVSSSSESSSDNEIGFLPSSSQAPHLVQTDDQQHRQQLSTYSSRRSSAVSTVCGISEISNNETEIKVEQEDQEQPVVVKTKETTPKKSENLSKEIEGTKEDKDDRVLAPDDAQNISESIENSSPENKTRDTCAAGIENENRSLAVAVRDQENKRQKARKKHGHSRSRNSNRNSSTDENSYDTRGQLSEEDQICRSRLQEVSSCEDAEENVNQSCDANRREFFKRRDVVKSQSCFNLNIEGDNTKFYPTDRNLVHAADKRFSYAGAGDVTVRSNYYKHLQLPLSLNLANDRGSERLDWFDAMNDNNPSGAKVNQRRGITSQCLLDSILETDRASSQQSNATLSDPSTFPTTMNCFNDTDLLDESNLQVMSHKIRNNRNSLESGPKPDLLEEKHAVFQKIPKRCSPDPETGHRPEFSHGSSQSLPSARPDSAAQNVLGTNNVTIAKARDDHTHHGIGESQMGRVLPLQSNRRKHIPLSKNVAYQNEKDHTKDELSGVGAKGRCRPQVPPVMSSTEIANIYARRQSFENEGKKLPVGRPNRPKSSKDGRHQYVPQLHSSTQSSKPECYLPKRKLNSLQVPYQDPNLSTMKDLHSAVQPRDPSMTQQMRESSTPLHHSFPRGTRDIRACQTDQGAMRDIPITFNVAAEKVAVCDDERALSSSPMVLTTGSPSKTAQPCQAKREDPNKQCVKNLSQNCNSLGISSNVGANLKGSLYKAKAEARQHAMPLKGYAAQRQRDKHKADPRLNPQQHLLVQKMAASKGPRGRQEKPPENQSSAHSELNGRDSSITSCHRDMYNPGLQRYASRRDHRSPMYTNINQPHWDVQNTKAPYHQQSRREIEQGLDSAEQNGNIPINYIVLQSEKGEKDIYV